MVRIVRRSEDGTPLVAGSDTDSQTPSTSHANHHSRWGATCAQRVLVGQSPQNCSDHINVLELCAVLQALKQWAPESWGQMVALNLDNRMAVAYIIWEGGMRSARLMEVMHQLLMLTDCWAILLKPTYLPGVANIEADPLSWRKQIIKWALLPGLAYELS